MEKEKKRGRERRREGGEFLGTRQDSQYKMMLYPTETDRG